MAELYLMTGISGVGKGTLIQKAQEIGAVFKQVNWGDVMLEVALKKGFVKSRDELKFMSSDKQKQLQEFTADHLKALQGKVVVDTHFALETDKGYLPGVPRNIVDRLGDVEGIIVIEAPAEEIARRRQKDVAIRQRVESAEREINEQLEMDRNYAAVLSFWFSKRL